MRKKTVPACVALWIWVGLFIVMAPCQGADQPPPEGSVLPEMNLPVPQEPEARKYLGIEGDKTFKIPEIKGEVVLIEVFSMYCPYCQQEAPRVNELYQLIAGRKNLKDRIKIIGIGAGNTPYEVNTFKNHYKIPFPLFSDPNLFFHDALGRVRTPYFIAVKNNKDGSHKVIYSKLGRFEDVEEFLKLITKRAELR